MVIAVWKEYAEGWVLREVTVVQSGSGKKDVAVTVIQSPDSQWNRLFQGPDTNTILACFPIAMANGQGKATMFVDPLV